MTLPLVLERDAIARRLSQVDVMSPIKDGFVRFSRGEADIPAPGELRFDDPPGDAHLKYGRLRGGRHYVVKIASGFPENLRRFGVSTSQGMILLFDARTGEPRAVLFDDGLLTRTRTAVAGAVCAEALGPPDIEAIGVLGSGAQARIQLEYLRDVTSCRRVHIWSQDQARAAQLCEHAAAMGYRATPERTPADVARVARLIVTTTRATKPLLMRDDVAPGTHITAVGSDTPDKVELDPALVARADVIVADSIPQCRIRGEIAWALRAGTIDPSRIVELGAILAHEAAGRRSPTDITIADLTGVAIQDLMIAEAVFDAGSSEA